MRTNRLYLTGILLACGWGNAYTTLAQQTTAYTLPSVVQAQAVFVLNSTIIVNGMLNKLPPNDIKAVMVYKGNKAEYPVQLRNLGAGIIDIKLAKRIKSQSFAKLGKQLGINGPVLFALNGHPLDAPTVAGLRIAPAAIGQLHIVRPTAGQTATLVDVWLAQSPKTESAPGTIMIRGTAGR
ncbi:hypothetical protein [Hymenobacter terrestris]|uniref:DUF4397 domain-containing protein n=1 Tax=Hymenobacter terrestris TaxID=2748310 RepID=A0ABX2PZH1_9BACT|nr:hypothetical protein [Hymenobacter terrestris]NVO84082.1 hypothetical protein [Hymenobacter terrestris]